jgi:23S rRNA G2445 N2-methylase RlmL
MSATRFRTFLACAPGLETTLCTEINRISSLIPSVSPSGTSHGAAAVQHVSKPRIETGGIELWLSPVALWTVCNFARCAESIRVRLGQPVKSTDFRSFRASAARLPLPAFHATGSAINAHVKATALKSKLIHTGGTVSPRWISLHQTFF